MILVLPESGLSQNVNEPWGRSSCREGSLVLAPISNVQQAWTHLSDAWAGPFQKTLGMVWVLKALTGQRVSHAEGTERWQKQGRAMREQLHHGESTWMPKQVGEAGCGPGCAG